MLNKIRNLIKFVTVKKHSDKRRMKIDYFDVKDKEVIALIPYGMFCKIKSEIKGFAFQQEGYEDSLFVIPIDLVNLDELDDDEVAFGIPKKKSRIKFDKDGNIIATGQDEKSIIKLDKDGNINENLEKDYSITGKGKYTGSFKDEVEISGEKKISLKAKQNIEITTEQKILIKNTAENLKDLIDTLINAFNSLPSATETAESHTHNILYTALIAQLTAIKNRFGTLFTS